MKALRAKAAAEVDKGTGHEGHDGQGALRCDGQAHNDYEGQSRLRSSRAANEVVKGDQSREGKAMKDDSRGYDWGRRRQGDENLESLGGD